MENWPEQTGLTSQKRYIYIYTIFSISQNVGCDGATTQSQTNPECLPNQISSPNFTFKNLN